MEKDKEAILARMQAAEFAIEQLEAGKFPHLKRFYSPSCEFRVVTDRFPFGDETPEHSVSENDLLASQSVALIRADGSESMRFVVFYEKSIAPAESTLLAESLRAIIGESYNALAAYLSPPARPVER